MGIRKEIGRDEIGVHHEVLTINVGTRSEAKPKRKPKRNLLIEATMQEPTRERRSALARRFQKKLQMIFRHRLRLTISDERE
jgi:hypothetical protein